MTSSRASDRLLREVLVGDGGMGSLLASRLPRLRFPEEANLKAREVVLAAHVEFIRAGADVIQTNTYGANAVKLGSHRLEDRVEELNEAGAKIAREAREIAGRDVLIAGSVGPLGTSVEVIGGETPRGASLYAEQAAVLQGRGADLIVLETFTSLEELTAAVAAVRAQCHLPIVAQITVQEEGETVTGARGDEVAAALAGLGVAAVGINCSLGPQSALAGLREMQRSAATPLTVQPNIGLPMYRDGRVLYPDASEPGAEPVEHVAADPGFALALLDPSSPVAIARTATFWRDVWERAGSAWFVQAGQYTMTPDQRPLIGQTEIDGLHVNTGYSGHGVMAGPAGAEILAELLAGTRTENPFRLDREFVPAEQAF